MRPVVFVHTNANQWVAAQVAAHAIRRTSTRNGRFDVRIVQLEDFPALTGCDGHIYLRQGRRVVYDVAHPQSFTLLRFLPPQLMRYQGRALLIDPDVFALEDVYDLLMRDMDGKAILCRRMDSPKGRWYASSVMLLDCGRLRHWEWEAELAELFALRRDYRAWVDLLLEPEDTIGSLEAEWNDFDTLGERTRLLHNTNKATQPWKTGLPTDALTMREAGTAGERAPSAGVRPRWPETYVPHPDPRQETLFFTLLRECVDTGVLSRDLLRSEVERGHIRPDVLARLQSSAALQRRDADR